MILTEIGQKAKKASKLLMNASTSLKNDALKLIADELVKNTNAILDANKKDVENAINNGTSKTMIDRLMLDAKRIESIAQGVMCVRDLPDPIGEVDNMVKRPNGLVIGKKRVPLGVIGIIYESRPNVTVDTAVLCLKSSNAVILRGGSDAINSNIAIANVMKNALEMAGFPEGTIEIIEDTSREVAKELMTMNEYVDVLIPRGGASLIKTVVQTATVPVIETGLGNCHAYIDENFDEDMAIDIIINAKTSRPSVCNALENLLINKNINDGFYKKLEKALNDKNVEIRCSDRALEKFENAKKATEDDFKYEFLDNIIAIEIVDNISDAIAHIDKYSTHHSEVIITKDYNNATKFLNEVDSAAVYVNASTRFTDGFEFGFGAEIGISTQKMHARGPMGLKELTSYKYIIYGDGQIRL